jgi:serine O-acetyltransferase
MHLTSLQSIAPVRGSAALWNDIRSHAQDLVMNEPILSQTLRETILRHVTLEAALCFRLADLLAGQNLSSQTLERLFVGLLDAHPRCMSRLADDINVVLERDPATRHPLDVVLHLKGFHAIQLHRFSHALWQAGRRDVAAHLQARSSRVFQVDIHPAVPMGGGIFFDHATGIVVGETAVIEDNVSMLQNVTLGGTGKHAGDRHPKVRHGVLIGAATIILGNIEIGANARIGAGSVVLKSVDPGNTVAGVPARALRTTGAAEPSRVMNHPLYDVGL